MFVPSPKLNETPVAIRRVTLMPLARVICSKAKLPRKVCPATFNSMPVPSTRRYGPDGTSSFTVLVPTVIVSLTAALVVFTETANVPLKVAPSDVAVVTVARKVPARPADVATKLPVPLATVTSGVLPSPKLSEPLVTPTRSTF